MKAMLTDQEHKMVWSDVDEPQVKADSVLIEVHTAAVNRADILQRQGKYPSPAGCPQWMGLEVAGVVVKTGAAVTRWKAGERVCALLGGGGYAEYVAVTEKMVMPIPQGLSFTEAASLPEAYATCYLNLFIEGSLKSGETVFFPAGNSGLASVGIPMAKAFGAYVITTVRTAEKRRRSRTLVRMRSSIPRLNRSATSSAGLRQPDTQWILQWTVWAGRQSVSAFRMSIPAAVGCLSVRWAVWLQRCRCVRC